MTEHKAVWTKSTTNFTTNIETYEDGKLMACTPNNDFDSMEEKYGHDSHEEYIENEFGPEKIKRGRWRIIHDEQENCHVLWHQCDKTEWDMEEVDYSNWSDYNERDILPRWRCHGCNAQPPDSIITLWCLMEPEWTSEMVQSCIQSPDPDERKEILFEWGMLASQGEWDSTNMANLSTNYNAKDKHT